MLQKLFWLFRYSKNKQCCSFSWIPLIKKWLRMTEERKKERNILFLQNWSVIIDISQSNFQKSFNTLMPMMSSSAELNPLADDHIFHRQRKSFITFENSFCRTHLSNAETWYLLKISTLYTANVFHLSLLHIIFETAIWVTSSDTGSVASRANTELKSSKCDWTSIWTI